MLDKALTTDQNTDHKSGHESALNFNHSNLK